MASTVTAQTFQVAITTSITLNGNARNTTNEVSIPNINEYDSRIMSIPSTSEVTVINTGSPASAGTFIKGDLKWFQVTNLDAVNYCRIRVNKVNTYGFDIRLDPGKPFIMGNTKESAFMASATFAGFGDFDSISAQADQATVDIEYIVAST
jgi:hypothetical protein